MKQYLFDAGEGKYRLQASVSYSADGISVYLVGGEAPHIGSVVLSEPRPSLTGEGMSCTSCVINRPGHKDEVLARNLAERLCCQTGVVVCVCAGVHVDHAAASDIEKLSENYEKLAQSIVDAFAAEGKHHA